jgi:hypothetical protein
MGSKVDAWLPRDSKFDNETWRSNSKQALVKAITKLSEADGLLGAETITTMKELAETPILWSRMPEYQSIDEYANERALDIAWP